MERLIMTTTLTVTNENFQEVLETVILGNIKFQNYHPDCFGMSDLRRADAVSALLEKLIDAVLDSSNSVFTLLQPTFLATGYDCNVHFNEKDFTHISEIAPFSVDIQDAQPIYEMCQSVKDGITDRDKFLADYKYR